MASSVLSPQSRRSAETLPDLPPLRLPDVPPVPAAPDLEPHYRLMGRLLGAVKLMPTGISRQTLDRFGDRQSVNDALDFLRRVGLVSVCVEFSGAGEIQVWFPGRWWEGGAK